MHAQIKAAQTIDFNVCQRNLHERLYYCGSQARPAAAIFTVLQFEGRCLDLDGCVGYRE
jgi:hypothetical protein